VPRTGRNLEDKSVWQPQSRLIISKTWKREKEGNRAPAGDGPGLGGGGKRKQKPKKNTTKDRGKGWPQTKKNTQNPRAYGTKGPRNWAERKGPGKAVGISTRKIRLNHAVDNENKPDNAGGKAFV